jgi:hypothetical protein
MSTHPYLRAYMAGIVFPTMFVLAIFGFFCASRFVYNIEFPIERFVIFPLALVPNLWGAWNIVHAAQHSHRRLPLGIHGALLPAILLPLALVVARGLDFPFPSHFVTAFWLVLPGIVIIYYLVWKYLVSFFNAMLGVA